MTKDFLNKILNSTTLEAAKAYAESALMVMETTDKVVPVLKSYEHGKIIQTVKALREILRMPNGATWELKQCKEAIDGVPFKLPEMTRNMAQVLANKLAEVGAKVEF